jgi:hypothetical protein
MTWRFAKSQIQQGDCRNSLLTGTASLYSIRYARHGKDLIRIGHDEVLRAAGCGKSWPVSPPTRRGGCCLVSCRITR